MHLLMLLGLNTKQQYTKDNRTHVDNVARFMYRRSTLSAKNNFVLFGRLKLHPTIMQQLGLFFKKDIFFFIVHLSPLSSFEKI